MKNGWNFVWKSQNVSNLSSPLKMPFPYKVKSFESSKTRVHEADSKSGDLQIPIFSSFAEIQEQEKYWSASKPRSMLLHTHYVEPAKFTIFSFLRNSYFIYFLIIQIGLAKGEMIAFLLQSIIQFRMSKFWYPDLESIQKDKRCGISKI